MTMDLEGGGLRLFEFNVRDPNVGTEKSGEEPRFELGTSEYKAGVTTTSL